MLRLLTLIFECVFSLSVVLQSVVILAESLTTTTTTHHVTMDYEVMMTNSCWSSTNECLIAANLNFNSGNILPITINCSVAENPLDVVESINSVVKRRYENISSVTLDGCGTALNVNTFGFEYIPNCEKITSLNLKNFHFDEIYEIICGSGIVLEDVCFEHNEFASLSAASVSNLRNLRTIKFRSNNLRHINVNAFDKLQELREISLMEEVNLRIRYANLFENLVRLENLQISCVDTVTSEMLLHLPGNLEDLIINKASLDNKTIEVIAPPTLKNITLTHCDFTSITIRGQEILTQLNLSSNSISQLVLDDCTHLKTLDLSSNNLTQLPELQFKNLHHLDHVYLQRNKLKRFTMLLFSNSLSHMQTIDLRSNDLKYIEDVNELLVLNVHLHIIIDGNPWNCLWLVNVSFDFPEQYRVFRYEKFISKINVNGLECMTYPPEVGSLDEVKIERKNSTAKLTIVYGGPREAKRNQKAEALVIVFMLPVGIAFLFVLLYLWINCQKLFHLSFYRGLPLGRSSAERFDIVRQMPLRCDSGNVQNQGYEIPAAGCKCTGHANKICCKFNVAYEDTTPHQNAAKVYEEIIEYNSSTGNCYYDHLNRE
ncbi:leucine-rich repeat protein soc-2 homolog [Eupeodes corollae]|uniref:leucine-rich repeat protein soc-2 homolog n=1 Tax=Eupeodes corollae TaxID=290404 RepID=UPI0024908CDC|nr:leucine-rich repeat protein soc-2 homolog [Eupeodes corollae]